MRLSIKNDEVVPSAKFVRAARSLRSDRETAVLAFHPVARMNPFQSLLYSRASHHGVAAVGAQRLEDLPGLSAALQFGSKALVHIHWTSAITGSAVSRDDAEGAVDSFHELLDELKSVGLSLVWTIHNRLPHRCPWPDSETRLRSGLAVRADAIHLMNPHTIDIVSDLFDVPTEKTFVCSHPSYLGAYPQQFEGRSARLELGIEQRYFVAGVVGSIQPYKGIEELLRAVPATRHKNKDFAALVAGIPGNDPDSVALVEDLTVAEGVVSLPTQLDDRTLTQVVTSLDIMVLPYRASLNSGAAMLALTFGVPILAPASGAFQTLVDAGFALGYDPSESGGLERALEEAPEFVQGVDRDAMSKYVKSLRGPVVSDEFFKGLWSMIGGR